MRREAIPLHSKRQAALVQHLNPKKNLVDPHKGIATHLLLGTGVRNDTVGHVHEDWFKYIEGELYIKIPSKEQCRKEANGGKDSCTECYEGYYYPKTPKGGGRQILVPNKYYNAHSKRDEYFGLKDRVESYFGLSHEDAPETARHGFKMIQADGRDGVSTPTVTGWVRDVCAAAQINKHRRASRLENMLDPDTDGKMAGDRINDFGVDDEGNPIPDVIAHDLRACFCTQMCRTREDEENPDLMGIKQKTGHKNIATLEKYVGYGDNEIDVEKDKSMF
jgi:hypothetical protein